MVMAMITMKWLTFIMCYISNSTGNKLAELVAKHYCGNEIKNAKTVLCNAFSKPFQKRNSTDVRPGKLAHVHDVIELRRQMDKQDKLPTSQFVAEAFGIARMQ